MVKRDSLKPIKSRWDARFLINTIMGVLEYHREISGDLVMGVVTAAVRSYSRGHMGKISLDREGEVYWHLKKYALERAQRDGKDAVLMKSFLQILEFAENDIREDEAFENPGVKLSAGFPLDSFTEEEVCLIAEKSRERFKAKFFCSDCEPRKGMLVFEDEEGLEAFSAWMTENHPELVHQVLDAGGEEGQPPRG